MSKMWKAPERPRHRTAHQPVAVVRRRRDLRRGTITRADANPRGCHACQVLAACGHGDVRIRIAQVGGPTHSIATRIPHR